MINEVVDLGRSLTLSKKYFPFFSWIDDFSRVSSKKQPCILDKIAIQKEKQKMSFLDNFFWIRKGTALSQI